MVIFTLMTQGEGCRGSSESQILECLLLAEGQSNQGGLIVQRDQWLGFGCPDTLKAVRQSGAVQAITAMKPFKAFLESQSHT